jgi:hypothetical protein
MVTANRGTSGYRTCRPLSRVSENILAPGLPLPLDATVETS